MSETAPDGLSSVIQAARDGMYPSVVAIDKPVVVSLPEGVRLEQIDLRPWRQNPVREQGTYRPATVEAFMSFVDRRLDPEVGTVWVHPTSGEVVAVFDDNGELPGWGDHRAILQLEHTPEWKHWTALDGKMVSQDEFAEHIEVGLEEIVEPVAADVLELAQSFHATSSSTFRQATRLQSGETKLQYDNSVSASAGRTGELAIPEKILLGIAPFVGEDPYKLVARFRYRLSNGQLTLGYKLDRPELVIRDALETIAGRIAERFLLTYVGSEPELR